MRLPPLLLLAAALAACGPRPEAAPPAPAPIAAAETPPAETAAPRRLYPEHCVAEEGCVEVCVLRDGRLAEVPVLVDPRTGDSTYLGRPFARAFPVDSTYAASASWFVDNYPLSLPGIRFRFVKYGLPRVLGLTELERAGEHGGVPLFSEAGWRGPLEAVYIPVRPGCVFQPYQASGPK